MRESTVVERIYTNQARQLTGKPANELLTALRP